MGNKNLRDVSRANYESDYPGGGGDLNELNAGSLQRIADAIEENEKRLEKIIRQSTKEKKRLQERIDHLTEENGTLYVVALASGAVCEDGKWNIPLYGPGGDKSLLCVNEWFRWKTEANKALKGGSDAQG